MLLRRDGGRRIAVAQPAHAALAGRLAGAWGNGDFPAPRPETVLAAALHDLGWAAWEREPTRDPATGWPLPFPQVPKTVHAALWREGVALARLHGRWTGLLVSRHADTIYQRHYDAAAASADERAAVAALLDEQHALQAEILASLRADPVAGDASDAAVERGRLLVAAVDEMSLHLCWGVGDAATVSDVPTAAGRAVALSLRPAGAGRIAVSPWPFAGPMLRAGFEGRRLDAPFASEEAMRRGLAEAPVVTVALDLVPG